MNTNKDVGGISEDDSGSESVSTNSVGKQSNSHDDSSSGSGLGNGSSSHSSTTPTGSGSGSGMSRTGGIPDTVIAAKDNILVRRSRLLVIGVLVCCAVAAGALAFVLTRKAEQENFETQFEDFAYEIEDVSYQKATNVYLAVESFSAAITSQSLAAKSIWPNFTMPHFEKHGEILHMSTGAQAIAFAPIVNDLTAWNQYSEENQGWIQESYNLRDDPNTPDPIVPVYRNVEDGSNGTILEDGSNDEYCPLWQEFRAPEDTSVINYNLLSHSTFARVFNLARDTKGPVLSEVLDPSHLFGYGAILETDDGTIHPESFLAQPVYDDFSQTNVVGTISSVIPWDTYFEGLLHEGASGIVCVLKDTCGDVFTYVIDGPESHYLGEGDLHNEKYDYLEHNVPFGLAINSTNYDIDAEADDGEGHCLYSLHLYPTEEFEEGYHTSKPAVFTTVVVAVFVFTTLVFVFYDYLVQKRQEKLQSHALKSNAIVSSLFPAEIRDRLFQQQQNEGGAKSSKSPGKVGTDSMANKYRLKTYLNNEDSKNQEVGDKDNLAEPGEKPYMYESKPIADLFPNTTVMFADIAGFTAWSSVREPSQVFTLLETVYRAFDTIAKRRKVFKVETVGDCYVAVTGLPEPRKDHAVAMCRFARDCMDRMNELTGKLEVLLGPDTGDLAMRFGLHSGPVTAGVLRGDKSRFQLFGDTVNTAARIESTGMRDKIHISQETADLLKEAGKEKWFVPRTDLVHAKGKGEMRTYWLLSNNGETGAIADRSDTKASAGKSLKSKPKAESTVPSNTQMSSKVNRLIDWNVDVLKRLLKLIVAQRAAAKTQTNAGADQKLPNVEKEILRKKGMVLDEAVDIVTLPKFDAKLQQKQLDPRTVEIPSIVLDQLREYVESIALLYRNNPFHNFEHASHVTMSVSKLLSRIVAPDIDVDEDNLAADLHDHTYGITSDPLTQFTVVISALIHDADHVGIPNFLLNNENKDLAKKYKEKSVAEQNSVDIAWKALMKPRFKDLRGCIYSDTVELERFRQLFVNTVLATDIFDKELSAQRKARWAKAFSTEVDGDNSQEAKNRKATIVIEHLIQASDVAHTMQHWHIYTKWNERLFAEMYAAYKTDRSSKDPSIGWFQGEIGFFDGYVIPLAKKLKECGVFGVSSDEYLNYALENRREWAVKGAGLVEKLVEKYGDSNPDRTEPNTSDLNNNP